jgi:UvrB/uvrC motif
MKAGAGAPTYPSLPVLGFHRLGGWGPKGPVSRASSQHEHATVSEACKESSEFFFKFRRNFDSTSTNFAPSWHDFASIIAASPVFARRNNFFLSAGISHFPMKRDLTPLLKEWPFKPGQVNARFVTGNDGSERVQVRLDLGLLQMHADGRPDGQKPFGFASLLEFFEAKLEDSGSENAHGLRFHSDNDDSTAPEDLEADNAGVAEPAAESTGDSATLSSDDCRALREEAAQFYQRYVACLALEDFDRVIRDTTRNLRVLDVCAKHASDDQDRQVLEQFRAYIIMVRARALASQCIKDNELRAAVLAIDNALDHLKKHFADIDKSAQFELADEVRMLRTMREALAPKLPISQKAELRQRLQRAIETENYELAAILRDELKQMEKQ